MSGLDFSTMLQAAAEDKLLIETLHRKLFDPDFKGMNVPVEAWTPKAYDGWFHPSTHSLWTIRQLYLYRTRPHLLEQEHMPLTGVLAVTAGTFWHRFIQMILLDDGILVQDEVPIIDDATHRLGHADGVLSNGQCLEIKTINGFQVETVLNEEVLKEKKPQYWAQTQDYLDCLHLREMRYLLLAPTFPFKMVEFIVHADDAYIARRRQEYQMAYELSCEWPDGSLADKDWAPDQPMYACCKPKSKEAKQCPVRLACPVGRFSV